MLYNLVTSFLNTIRSWVGLVLPVFAKAADFRGWNPWVWRVIHALLIAGILALLWWLDGRLEFSKEYLKEKLPLVRELHLFLALIFLLLYALSWIGYWLWRLLGED